VESDMPTLRLCVAEQLKRLGLNGERPCPVSDDWVAEYCRWGGAETHNIASVRQRLAPSAPPSMLLAPAPLAH